MKFPRQYRTTTSSEFPVTGPTLSPELDSTQDQPYPKSHSAVGLNPRFGDRSSGDHLLQLQRQYGNRYVSRLVEQTRRSTNSAIPPTVQTKLVVGPAADRYEQEADRVARQIVGRVQSSTAQEADEAPTSGAPSSDTQASLGAHGGPVGPGLQQSIEVARAGGQPLAENVRRPLEEAFGADFSRVRVHTNVRADALSSSLEAHAFTSGRDIFFRQGSYRPGSRRLPLRLS